jgi:hypothetical protein
VNERILLEPEGDFELVLIGAGEVHPDGGNWDWTLRLGETELHHESMLLRCYLTSLGLVYMSEMWY